MPLTRGLRVLLIALVVATSPFAVEAQIVREPATGVSSAPVATAPVGVDSAVRAQAGFEAFRVEALVAMNFGPVATVSKCDEIVGMSCYIYDEHKKAPPPEPASIRAARERLITLLDSVAVHSPESRWAVEQRVRYLDEAGRPDSALAAAKACKASGWACAVLLGFAQHETGRYASADSSFARGLAQMDPRLRCEWRDVTLLVDEDTRRQYARYRCGDTQREVFEDRTWYFARTLYSLDANDSRTEHYARKTMEMMFRDAPAALLHRDAANVVTPSASPEAGIRDEDEIEKLLRFGWPRAWVLNRRSIGNRVQVVGWHWSANPAYRFVPPGSVLSSPALSDSADWRLQLAPVVARYAPAYATSLTPLEHQKAMFKRGDTALVVMAYDARVTKPLAGGKLTASVVVTPDEKPTDYGKIVHDAPETGVLMARAPWGPLLMSAEVYAPDKKAVARARYGLAPPFSVGTRVTVSDLLFYNPYGAFPKTLDEAAPHALPTERVMANEKLGVFWEAYGTDPAGEKMEVSLTVLKEVGEAGFLKRKAEALKLVHEATPVVVSVEDLSAPGANTTPRALELDISTLKKGSYIVQLELALAGQYVIRAEHRIEVIGP